MGEGGVIGEAFRRTEDPCMRRAHETSKMDHVRVYRLESTLQHTVLAGFNATSSTGGASCPPQRLSHDVFAGRNPRR